MSATIAAIATAVSTAVTGAVATTVATIGALAAGTTAGITAAAVATTIATVTTAASLAMTVVGYATGDEDLLSAAGWVGLGGAVVGGAVGAIGGAAASGSSAAGTAAVGNVAESSIGNLASNSISSGISNAGSSLGTTAISGAGGLGNAGMAAASNAITPTLSSAASSSLAPVAAGASESLLSQAGTVASVAKPVVSALAGSDSPSPSDSKSFSSQLYSNPKSNIIGSNFESMAGKASEAPTIAPNAAGNNGIINNAGQAANAGSWMDSAKNIGGKVWDAATSPTGLTLIGSTLSGMAKDDGNESLANAKLEELAWEKQKDNGSQLYKPAAIQNAQNLQNKGKFSVDPKTGKLVQAGA